MATVLTFLMILLTLQQKKENYVASSTFPGSPNLQSTIKKDKTELAFSLADKNKDGNVDKKEFEKMFKNLQKEKADKLFDHLDKNNDGKLDFSEFKDMMDIRKKK